MTYEIPFSSAAPSLSDIFTELTARTGLPLSLASPSVGIGAVHHSEFSCTPMIACSEKAVSVSVFIGEDSYILLALLATLVHMGGAYPGELPGYAYARWDALVDVHDEIRDATRE